MDVGCSYQYDFAKKDGTFKGRVEIFQFLFGLICFEF